MYAKCLLLLLSLSVCAAWSAAAPTTQDAQTSDLLPAETSAKLLNLGGLFGQSSGYPNYGGYGQQYPNYGGQYGGYNNRPYYPSSGYYPSTGYYPNTGSGGYYPSTGGYYPNTGSYYPTTNILGNSGYGGYGGYGGNGGLRQYSGYWQPDYSGQRNRGYGYYAQTDRFGLPASRDRDNYRDRGSYSGYRGYD